MFPDSPYPSGELGVDANGCLTETTVVDGQSVVVHYDDIPESDITTVKGVRTTTPLRTTIDLAASLSPDELDSVLAHFMGRGTFTRDDVRARLDRPDMTHRPGARRLREHLRL